ncbi:TIGR00730 family Rossman fold protein [Magnetospirillum moscoviense]|uniref:Cytokinin riboside 5'-monophosphate phosphoribohydrolase n=1 Tax=Magnetospirillum moscoviense TaxID=1437059 RepID=A0A178MFH2_9PROT|nr:TIGR00730 family Rossman fold protein [Magnetospirillum moscoviense]MBF0323450.1 TIGR00730 family Rossman fold protein [Alphaproteobacteria bacterium]OAN47511.1 Rossman fold protein, TIGR00730 family [Magnetospirillum moscoviense]
MQRVCVFCGSSMGNRPVYAEAAAALGRLVAERGLGLVYGGGNVGLMGITANAALAAGGEVIGIIPEALMRMEVGHIDLTQLHVVGSMHERKALMADMADAFIALPGGIGTMEELFEVWTWGQLGLHPKPLGFLDVDGYFDHLHTFLDHMVAEGFLRARHRAMVAVESDASTLLDRFAAYQAPDMVRVIARDTA